MGARPSMASMTMNSSTSGKGLQEVYIVAACRTAIGKMGGTLKSVTADILAAELLKDIPTRAGVPAEAVDEVILGQTRQSTDASNIARYSALLAGYPEKTVGCTLMQQCSSGMVSLHMAMDRIQLGRAGVIIAGGVESLSTAPFYMRGARYGFGTGNNVLLDSVTEGQINSQPVSIYGAFPMGVTAENIAEKYKITREEQDAFAFQSQTRYQAAFSEGKFKKEITPLVLPQRKGDPLVFDTDEHPRLSPMETLAKLKPVFKEGGTVTAGNSCGRNDGSCVLMLMSEQKAKEYGVKPLARMVSQGVTALDPRYMGLGPIGATRVALKTAGLTIDDIDLIELNEAFAAQSLACINELRLDQSKVNVNGGAIALGHPLGASGARITTTLLYEMMCRKVRYGLATLCVGGGMGSATIIERV